MKELITESIAKGVELGIAKALSVIESQLGMAPMPTRVDQGTVIGASSLLQQRNPLFLRDQLYSIVTPAVGQAPAMASSFLLGEVHSITASSLPQQIPGRPGLDATSRANTLDHLVPKEVKDKIGVCGVIHSAPGGGSRNGAADQLSFCQADLHFG